MHHVKINDLALNLAKNIIANKEFYGAEVNKLSTDNCKDFY